MEYLYWEKSECDLNPDHPDCKANAQGFGHATSWHTSTPLSEIQTWKSQWLSLFFLFSSNRTDICLVRFYTKQTKHCTNDLKD